MYVHAETIAQWEKKGQTEFKQPGRMGKAKSRCYLA